MALKFLLLNQRLPSGPLTMESRGSPTAELRRCPLFFYDALTSSSVAYAAATIELATAWASKGGN